MRKNYILCALLGAISACSGKKTIEDREPATQTRYPGSLKEPAPCSPRQNGEEYNHIKMENFSIAAFQIYADFFIEKYRCTPSPDTSTYKYSPVALLSSEALIIEERNSISKRSVVVPIENQKEAHLAAMLDELLQKSEKGAYLSEAPLEKHFAVRIAPSKREPQTWRSVDYAEINPKNQLELKVSFKKEGDEDKSSAQIQPLATDRYLVK